MLIHPARPQTAQTAQLAPIEWFVFEERGAMTAHAGRWEHTLFEAWANDDGRALLTDGRMSFPHDPGVVEDAYESLPRWVRDGVDADAAQDAAREGVALLTTALEAALPELDAYRVPSGARPDRGPEQLDLWIRTAAGDRLRYLVPVERAPQSLLDARAAAHGVAAQIRRDYIAQAGTQVGAQVARRAS